MRAVWAHKLIAIELEATLGVIAATWILAMLMIHRTKVVPRGIDRLIRFPRERAGGALASRKHPRGGTTG